MQVVATKKRIDLQKPLFPTIYRCFTSMSGACKQVIDNLLSNAFSKFTPEGGGVVMAALVQRNRNQRKRQVKVIVSDT